MRAYALTGYKKSLEERNVPEPAVGPHDVLIRVEAAGLNILDDKIRLGEFKQILPYKLPRTLGHDVAGTVLEVGSAVRAFAPGDEVYSRPDFEQVGTFAERVAVHEKDVARRPSTVSMAEAGSLPLVALTAWQALVVKGNVRPGQKVLIHAGAGGVGTIAIQLAKHLGATVVTTASARNADFLRELGADIVIDYRSEDFEDGDKDYDLVLDSVGGENLEKSLRVLKRGGKAIGITGPPDPAFVDQQGLNFVLKLVITALSAKVRKQAKKLGVTYQFLFMQADGAQLSELASLVDQGVIRPVVGKTVRFDEIPTAVEALSSGGARGKTVAVA